MPGTEPPGKRDRQPRSIAFSGDELAALHFLRDTHPDRYASIAAVLQDYCIRDAVDAYQRARDLLGANAGA